MQLFALLGCEFSDATGWARQLKARQTVSMKLRYPFIDAGAADFEKEGNLSTGMAVLEMGECEQSDAHPGISLSFGKGKKIDGLRHERKLEMSESLNRSYP